MVASAAGVSRREVMARSMSTQVISDPTAICPSGRRPLLNGNQDASSTKPAAHAAGLLRATAGPKRGSTSRLIKSQQTSDAIRSGSRIHRLISLNLVMMASRL
ncbi:Uncharacterised protein [Mycobacteroides abscessus subsp. abscessus]|nr:Uncharacterised protein [Mycobacteroides abscessus subsp. abscessus]